MWMTSAANGRVYAIDPQAWTIEREFVPPSEALGITATGSDLRLILAPAIDEPDLERDRRYVYRFSPDVGSRSVSSARMIPDRSSPMRTERCISRKPGTKNSSNSTIAAPRCAKYD